MVPITENSFEYTARDISAPFMASQPSGGESAANSPTKPGPTVIISSPLSVLSFDIVIALLFINPTSNHRSSMKP